MPDIASSAAIAYLGGTMKHKQEGHGWGSEEEGTIGEDESIQKADVHLRCMWHVLLGARSS